MNSPGLTALKEAVSEEKHEVWMSAPDREKSGSSHSITFAEAVRTREIAENTLLVAGSPADCVLSAFRHFLPEQPDLVISGINIGANLGGDIVYSGTAGAARQAVFLGVPGVAVSLNTFSPPFHLRTAAQFIARNMEDFATLWHESGNTSHFLNINVPNVEHFAGSVLVAPPAKLVHENKMVSFSSPRGETYCFYEGTERVGIFEDIPTDVDLVEEGNIVVTPVQVYPELSETAEFYARHTFTTDGGPLEQAAGGGANG